MVQMILTENGKLDKPKEEKQIDSLKAEISRLNETIALIKQSQEKDFLIQQVRLLQEQNKALQDNYNFILRKLLENGKSEEKTPQLSQRMMHLDVLQLLTLLQKAGALNQMMAIQAKDIQQRFEIACTEKTLRNKLNEMEIAGLVSYVGLKPKKYFITPDGINLLSKEKQTMLQLNTIQVRSDNII